MFMLSCLLPTNHDLFGVLVESVFRCCCCCCCCCFFVCLFFVLFFVLFFFFFGGGGGMHSHPRKVFQKLNVADADSGCIKYL